MKKFLNSFKYAVSGIIFTFKNERNFRIMIYFGAFVIFLTIYFNIQSLEKIIIYFIVALVLIFELINTAFEQALNEINREFSQNIKNAKDIITANFISSQYFGASLTLLGTT